MLNAIATAEYVRATEYNRLRAVEWRRDAASSLADFEISVVETIVDIMRMWNLNEDAIRSLTELPETGMGFQLVEAVLWGNNLPLLVLNSERAIDLRQVKLTPGDDPATILRNGMLIIDSMKLGVLETLFAAPQPHSFRLLNARIGQLPGARGAAAAAAPQAVMPSSLVKHLVLSTNRVFHRFSAFNPDRRVDPFTGSFLPGTYAVPESEVPFVPTGFVAVGRFALPNNLPASFHYQIEAPVGTAVAFGTVAPAFGQAGGGVEAYFDKAVINAKIPSTAVSKIPDE